MQVTLIKERMSAQVELVKGGVLRWRLLRGILFKIERQILVLMREGSFATALPPDVRRRLRPAVKWAFEFGAMPRQGRSPIAKRRSDGRA